MNRREYIIAVVALGAAGGPIASFAQQQGKVWRVGFLSLSSASESVQNTATFLKALRELGYIEGKNLVVEWRFAEGSFERLTGQAADLVQLKVDVIVAVASAAIGAAQKATTTIPIVMTTTGDPVGSGFVKSLAHPGGNITGLSNMGGDTGTKHVDILLAVLPKLVRGGWRRAVFWRSPHGSCGAGDQAQDAYHRWQPRVRRGRLPHELWAEARREL